MRVLGWHGGWYETSARTSDTLGQQIGVTGHDASAALWVDDRIVFAAEEERYDRIKHSSLFPRQALRACLSSAGLGLDDIDVIAVDCAEPFLDQWMFERSSGTLRGGRTALAELFTAEFGVDVHARLRFVRHHHAHLHGVRHAAGFKRSLIAILDAMGDGPSGMIAMSDEQGIRPLRTLQANQSLGYFYLRAISVLGYRLFDEYKVMGLAPYGDPARFEPLLSSMYALGPNGEFALVSDEERIRLLSGAGLINSARRKGSGFEQWHMDFAAALQVALERIVMHLLDHFQKTTGIENLALSGGVAHNCAMNGVILRSGLFRNVFAMPAAHDGGNAIGAAVAIASPIQLPLAARTHMYLGDVPTDDVAERLNHWRGFITWRRAEDAAVEAAVRAAAGDVVAWVQGRAEFGPRALGNRSIVADPRPEENKRRINAMVKSRESYRPFAPSVLIERWREYFDVPDTLPSSDFMTLVVPVREAYREQLGAITHVDGTARIQTVHSELNPRYHRLISHFAELTGVAMVLNTSLNNNAEPIVQSADDAIACLLTTELDVLILDDFVVTKVVTEKSDVRWLELQPRLALSHRLVRGRDESDAAVAEIVSFLHPVFGEPRVAISHAAAHVLDGGQGSARDRCESLRLSPGGLLALAVELFDLWQRRVIFLHPVQPDRDDQAHDAARTRYEQEPA